MDDDLLVTCAHWDERAPAHAASPGYDVQRFATHPDWSVPAILDADLGCQLADLPIAGGLFIGILRPGRI